MFSNSWSSETKPRHHALLQVAPLSHAAGGPLAHVAFSHAERAHSATVHLHLAWGQVDLMMRTVFWSMQGSRSSASSPHRPPGGCHPHLCLLQRSPGRILPPQSSAVLVLSVNLKLEALSPFSQVRRLETHLR